MPHHHGRSGRSMGVKQGGGGSGGSGQITHHSSNVYKSTTVSSGAAKRQKKAVGANALDTYKVKKVGGVGVIPMVLNAAQALRQKTFEINRKYFKDKVLTSKNVGNYEYTLDSYSKYMKSRTSGEIDAYGNPISQHRDGPPVVKKVVGGQTLLAQGPTDAEVSQSDATSAAETKLTKRRVKARGRKMNVYAQSKDKLILGKKSLLGMV